MYDCELLTNEFYSWSEPIARKIYSCSECSSPIEKGERYFKANAKCDGNFFVERQHLLCCEACMKVRDMNEGDCLPFGALHLYAHEYRLDIAAAAENGSQDAKDLRAMLAMIKWRERKTRQPR